MAGSSLALAFVAGTLSILSPCVLPMAPIVVATALSKHKLGVLALIAGLASSFTVLGLLMSMAGFTLGLDDEAFRVAGAILLIGFGAALAVPWLHDRLALVASPVVQGLQQRFAGQLGGGLMGQFGVGALLGAVWAPCSGPTLGAAITLASEGRNLLHVTTTMVLFSAGTATPLVVLGSISRSALMRWRGRLLVAGTAGKLVLATVLISSGVLVLSGLDKAIEEVVLDHLPPQLLDLIARY